MTGRRATHADSLRPMPPLVLGRGARPRNMATVKLPPGMRETIESIALDIFTDMTNAGCSLQQTLAAIYLSGSEHALRAREDA